MKEPTTTTSTTTTPSRDPNAIPVADLALILAKLSGREINAGMIEADLAAGAPSNPDGTIHLIHYGAWLIRQTRRPASGRGDHAF